MSRTRLRESVIMPISTPSCRTSVLVTAVLGSRVLSLKFFLRLSAVDYVWN